jgi:hypothetical protein
MHHQRQRLLFYSSLAACVAYPVYYLLLRPLAAAPDAYGLFTEQQILERARPIYRLLAPEVGRSRLVAERHRASEADGRSLREWRVECSDESGQGEAYFVWDADRGDLLRAAHTVPHPVKTAGKPLGSSDAVQAARYWLRVMGVVDAGGGWRLNGSPEWQNYRWVVRWAGKGGTVFITIDEQTGSFTQMLSHLRQDRWDEWPGRMTGKRDGGRRR